MLTYPNYEDVVSVKRGLAWISEQSSAILQCPVGPAIP